ncbi:MAG: thioredoxin family protein [Methanobrevibacter sp.]|nr:thioredoxin family protein [Methanobrevibacter sp.]
MKNSYKIICVIILLISFLAIIAIVASGIFSNDSDRKGCLTVFDTSDENNIIINDSGIQWNENYTSAILESKKTNKPMFVYFWASWCSYCKQLESETFTNLMVQREIAENYIPVKVDGDTYPELCSKYNVMGFPTLIIIDSNEKKLDSIEGFYSASELLNRIS